MTCTNCCYFTLLPSIEDGTIKQLRESLFHDECKLLKCTADANQTACIYFSENKESKEA